MNIDGIGFQGLQGSKGVGGKNGTGNTGSATGAEGSTASQNTKTPSDSKIDKGSEFSFLLTDVALDEKVKERQVSNG